MRAHRRSGAVGFAEHRFMANSADTPLLRLRGIAKNFGDKVALAHVDLDVEAGEVHVICGENGAGKSTLMNILAGILSPDAGQIFLDGAPVRFADPIAAGRAGIGMVHQHFKLVASMSVAENLFLNRQPLRLGFVSDRRGDARARTRADRTLPFRPRSRRAGRAVVGRAAPARGGPEGARLRRPHPDSGRTDGGPHSAGGRRTAGRDRPTEGARAHHPVHHSQTPGGEGRFRSGHGAAARPQRLDTADDRPVRGGHRARHGRTRSARRREEPAVPPPARRCWPCRASPSRPPPAGVFSTASTSRYAPARSSESLASMATARPNSARRSPDFSRRRRAPSGSTDATRPARRRASDAPEDLASFPRIVSTAASAGP